MLSISIGDWSGLLPESSKDVTLFDMIKFCNDIEPLQPQSMKDLNKINQLILEADNEDKRAELKANYDNKLSSIDELELTTKWARYFEKELQYWCKMPNEYLGKVAYEDLLSYRNLILNNIYKAKLDDNFISFDFNGVTYYAPANMPNIMSNATLIEFIESMQANHYYNQLKEAGAVDENGLRVSSHWNALVNIICVLFRKKDEEFYDEIVDDRRNEFLDLPLDIAQQCWFFFVKCKTIYT